MTFDKTWEDVHQKMDWGLKPSPLFTRFFDENFKPPHYATFLDLGCGVGAQAVFLAAKGCHVIAVDASPTAIEKAQGYILGTDCEKYTDYRINELVDLRLEPASIDCVVDICCLQHLPLDEARETLTKTQKWLKPEKGWVFSKMATEPFDLSVSRTDYIRMSTIDDIKEIFVGYEGHTYQVAEILPDKRKVTHFVTEAWLPGAQRPCFPSRLI